MHVRRYTSHLMETTRRRNMMTLLAIMLAVSNAMLAGLLLKQDRSERVVLMPPVLEKTVSFQSGRFNDAYLEQMAVYMAELILTYHADNVRYRIRQFLRYSSPDSHSQLADLLESDATRVIHNKVSAAFFPQATQVVTDRRQVIVKGLQTRMVGGHVVADRQLTLLVMFADSDRWQVEKIMEVDDNGQDAFHMLADDSSG